MICFLMKPLFRFICLLLYGGLSVLLVQAQTPTPYNNEWIDYNQTYYRFKTAESGLRRISYATLQNLNLPTVGFGYRLYKNGQPVPLYVSKGGNLSENDFLEFIVAPNDGSFDTQLYKTAAHQPSVSRSLYTDTAAYYLTWSDALMPEAQYTTFPNLSPPEGTALLVAFNHTARKSFFNRHYPGQPVRLSNTYNYLAEFEDGEGYGSMELLEGDSLHITLPTPAAHYAGGIQANVSLKFLGRTDDLLTYPDHHATIKINGVPCYDVTFDGYRSHSVSFPVPISHIKAETRLTVTVMGDTSAEEESIAVASAQISYMRTFDLKGVGEFQFSTAATANEWCVLHNFDGGTAPVVYDNANRFRITPTFNDTTQTWSVYLPYAAPSINRDWYVFNTDNVTYINNVEEKHFSPYPAQEGNYIIITHPTLWNVAQQYAAYRSSAAGGAFEVQVVNVEELYEQFALGIAKHPLAIQNYLRYARNQWSSPPEYMLLLGKSIEYQYCRNTPNNFARCLVPSFGYPAGDMLLAADSPADFRPRLAVGRIPAADTTQALNYLDKLKTFDAARALPCNSTDRRWQKRALNLSSGYGESDAAAYKQYIDSYTNILERGNYGFDVVGSYTQASGNIIPQAAIGEWLNKGVALINYMGHPTATSPTYWNIDIGTPQSYDNAEKLAFYNSNSCFSGNIHQSIGTVMAEDYILAAERGAIGYLAVVGYGFPAYSDRFNEAFYNNLINKYFGAAAGTAVQYAIGDIYSNENGIKKQCQSLVYVGDPAVQLYHWQQPELVLLAENIAFSPQQPRAGKDFIINVTIENWGRVMTEDSFFIHIKRILPNGEAVDMVHQKVPITTAKQLFSFVVDNKNMAFQGVNTFEISIDNDNTIAEDCEDNNSITQTITILPDPCPDVPLQIVLDSTVFCRNTNENIVLQGIPNGGVFRLDGVVVNSFNPAALQQGRYFLEYQYENNGCEYITAQLIEVSEIPDINCFVPQKVCIGDTLQLAYTGVVYPNATYEWNFGEGASPATASGIIPPPLWYGSSGNKSISLTVHYGVCESTISKPLRVDAPLAAVNISVISSNNNSITLQLNQAVSPFYGVLLNGTPAPTPAYSQNDILTIKNLSENTTYNIAVYAAGNTPQGNACGFGDTSNVVTAATLLCEPLTAQIDGIPTQVCLNDAPYTLILLPEGGNLQGKGIENGIFYPKKAGIGTHTLSYSYIHPINGCEYNALRVVNVNLEPSPSISGDTMWCDGGLITLTALEGFSAYSWNNGSTTQTTQADTAGIFMVWVEDVFACAATASHLLQAAPMPQLFLPDNDTLSAYSDLLLNPLAQNSHSFVWSDGSTSSEIWVNAEGSYWVTASNEWGCTATDSVRVWSAEVGLPTTQTATSWRIAPNLVQRAFYVYSDDERYGQTTAIKNICLINTEGKRFELMSQPQEDALYVNVAHIAAGLYTVSINSSSFGERYIGKIVILP